MMSYREQFSECTRKGFTNQTEFYSFKDHPEIFPAFPNEKMIRDLKENKLSGVDVIICGKFGGRCSSHNEKCIELRNKTT